MYKTFTLLFLLLTSNFCHAQAEFVEGCASAVVYSCISTMNAGGADLRYTHVNGTPSLVWGVKGGWELDPQFALYTAAYSTIPFMSSADRAMNLPKTIISYGGIQMEFRHFIDDVQSINFPVLIGGGGVTRYNDEFAETIEIFVLEPGVYASFTFGIIRLEVGGSYRLAFGGYEEGYGPTSFWFPSVGGSIIMGDFYGY